MPLTPDDVRAAAFHTAPALRAGYRRADVDELLDRVADRMAAGVSYAHLVRGVVLPTARGGYDLAVVDAFLALVADTDETGGLGAPAASAPSVPSAPSGPARPSPFVEERSWRDRLRRRG